MELTHNDLINIGHFRARLAELSAPQLKLTYDALTACVAAMDGAINTPLYGAGGADLLISAAEDFLEARTAVYDEAVKRKALTDASELHAIQWVILSHEMECGEPKDELIASILDVASRGQRPAA